MSAAADALNVRVRISDPKPAYCSACFRAADDTSRFLDFDAALDTGCFVDGLGVYQSGSDDLHLCEECVRVAAQTLGLKPDLHARQMREIKRLEIANEHWKDYAKRMEALVQERPEKVGR
jgi:hypothetical protein